MSTLLDIRVLCRDVRVIGKILDMLEDKKRSVRQGKNIDNTMAGESLEQRPAFAIQTRRKK